MNSLAENAEPQLNELEALTPEQSAVLTPFGKLFLTQEDAAHALALIGGEPALGNPSTDGYVLSSTSGGVRSWIPRAAGAVTGPNSAIDGHVAVFNGTSGAVIKDAGVVVSGVNTGDQDLSGLVPKTTTVNGHALSASISITQADIGIGNVTNDVQTKASIVPNTAPADGQLLIGNGGVYLPTSITGSGATMSLSASGVLSISQITNASLNNASLSIAGTSVSLGGSIALDTITNVSANGYLKRTGTNILQNVVQIPNGDLANSSVTLNAGTNFGITSPGAITLGSIVTIGSTSDSLRFSNLGLNVAAPSSGGQISMIGGANNITLLQLQRKTDTSPTGNFVSFLNAAASALWTVDITGSLSAGAIPSARLTGNIPASWLGSSSSTAAAGNDSRLSDNRTANAIQTATVIAIGGPDPTDGQVLTYVLANSRWQAVTPSGGGGGGSGTVGSGTTSQLAYYASSGTTVSGLSVSSNLSVGGTLDTVQGIQTSSSPQFSNIGFGVAAATSGGQIKSTLGANNITAILVKRNTDTSPTGKFLDFQNAAAASVFTLDITGTVVTGTWQATAIANAYLANSSIGIAGNSVSLGGSITLDTITGVSSNGYLKRTGANTFTNVSAIGNGDLANSAITIQGVSVSLGGSALATSSAPQFATLGLGVAADGTTALKVTGPTISTNADGTVATINSTSTYTKNDANTRAFHELLLKPTFNTGASNTNTTVNILSIDSTNTATTGLTVNLLRLAYGGTQQMVVSSSGIITAATWQAVKIGLAYGGTNADLSATGGSGQYLKQSSSGAAVTVGTIAAADLPGSFSGFANPTASVGLAAANGSATTAMRSDASPALSQSIAPTWTSSHAWKLSDAVTNTFTDVLTLGHNSSGTPAASYGGSLLFQLESSNTNDRNAGRLGVLWTTATDASRTSAFVWQLVSSAGALTEVARLFASGGLSVNSTTDPGAGIINANSGFRIGNAAASGNVLRGNGTNFVSAQLACSDLSGGIATANGILKGNGSGTISAATAGTDYTSPSSTETMTNKRITPRVNSTTSSTSWTPNFDSNEIEIQTALAGALTVNSPTYATANQGDGRLLRIKDNGTARAISWNGIFRAVGVTLPTTTVLSKTLYVGMIYNSTDTKWDVIAVKQE